MRRLSWVNIVSQLYLENRLLWCTANWKHIIDHHTCICRTWVFNTQTPFSVLITWPPVAFLVFLMLIYCLHAGLQLHTNILMTFNYIFPVGLPLWVHRVWYAPVQVESGCPKQARYVYRTPWSSERHPLQWVSSLDYITQEVKARLMLCFSKINAQTFGRLFGRLKLGAMVFNCCL